MRPRYQLIIYYLAEIFTVLGLVLVMKGCEAKEVNINIVIEIESSGNPNAYNKKSGAIGLMQITPIVLTEYVQNHSEGKLINGWWVVKDKWTTISYSLFDQDFNIKVGTWYLNTRIPQMLREYNVPDTINHRLISYNWGIGHLTLWYHKWGREYNKLPKETQRYIKKYHKLTEEKIK